ncbi:hypothetical protein DV738_g2811, partial [Chaetothyriales sp. CBS 135597]
MSEYWKSTPKYWCKHCSTYVRDTPFERRQHESTAKHQGKLKHFLRDIQNNHERSEREKEKAKAEVERLNRITGTGVAPPSLASAKPSTRTPTASKEKGGQRTVDDQKRQWQQLADMGIKVPDHVRTEMAMAGDWQAVRQHNVEGMSEDRLSVGVRKRKAADEEEDELEEIPQAPSQKKVWGEGGSATSVEQSDHSGAQSAAKTEPKAEDCDGTEGVIRSIPEEAAAPVFKKRKAKGKS